MYLIVNETGRRIYVTSKELACEIASKFTMAAVTDVLSGEVEFYKQGKKAKK